MKKMFALVSIVVLLAATPVMADVLLSDDFESYVSTTGQVPALLGPGGWDADSNAIGVLNQDPNFGNPGKSLFHNGFGDDPNNPVGISAKRVFTPTAPSDDKPIIWEFDFYDDGIGNKRVTGGLRTDGDGQPLTSILELGLYNSFADPNAEPNDPPWPGYGVRTVFIAGDPGNWVTLRTEDSTPAVEEGWHHFKATIKASEILFEMFLDVDDPNDPNEVKNSYAKRRVITPGGAGDPNEPVEYNIARLGGPSDLWSSGGGGYFDNVLIYVDDSGILLGDVETDGVLDWRDAEKFLGLMLDGPYQAEADMNEDGVVNGLDRQPFVDALRAANPSATMAIPEPSALVLLAAGMLLLAGVRLYHCRSG